VAATTAEVVGPAGVVVVVEHGTVVEVVELVVELVEVVELDVDVVDVDVVVVVAPVHSMVVEVVVVTAVTTAAALMPVIELVVVSVAVMVWLPTVLKVAVNVPTPSASAEVAGSLAAESDDLKVTSSA